MRKQVLFFVPLIAVTLALSLALPAYAQSTADKQAQLQAQLDQVNQEIQSNQTKLQTEQKQRTSLERDVAILDYQIQEAQLEIKQRNLTIEQLNNSIAQKQKGIQGLDAQVSAGEQSLAQIIRETDQIDRTPLVETVLNGGSLTDVFNTISDFQTIQGALGNSFTKMAAQRSDLAARKSALEQQQQEEQGLLQIQELQQNRLKQTEQQKQNLVAAAKGQEAIYQQIIAAKQQTASEIRSALFALNNASHSTSFGDMYQYAKEASALTGVRPAVILAILSEESDLGKNVGSCSYHSAMDPSRDVPDFMQITKELGLDPETMKVSCKPWYGWGGAMGPAQFIPSTWKLYEARIAKATGQNPPNPWDPRTATFATAILMMDNGADAGTPAAERLAALRYFAGWRYASNPAYAFYGNDVMALAAKLQKQINVLNG